MNEQEQRAVDILRELGGRPAASFFEGGPTGYIVEALSEMGLDPHLVAVGQLLDALAELGRAVADLLQV